MALAIYETAHLLTADWRPVSGLLLATFINTTTCYWLALCTLLPQTTASLCSRVPQSAQLSFSSSRLTL